VLSNMSLPRAYRQLYHYRARAYDPLHGRFAQRDPAEYEDGMNLYDYARSSPIVIVDPFGRWSRTAEQLVGRYGEILLRNAIKASKNHVILYGLQKPVWEHGPDLITYNRRTGAFEFWDNKAYQRSGRLYRTPKWMTDFSVKRYEQVIRRGIAQNVKDPMIRDAYEAALERALKNPSKALRAITSFGGRLTGVGPAVAESGVQFVTRETLQATGRGGVAAAGRSALARGAGGLCRMVFTRSTAVLTALLEVPEAGRGSAWTPEIVEETRRNAPVAAVDEVLQELERGAPDRYRPHFSYEELQRIREDLVSRGLLVRRRTRMLGYKHEVYRYRFRSDLDENDLDYINGKINMRALLEGIPLGLEVLNESSIDWVGEQ
jgi:hypothetical protein